MADTATSSVSLWLQSSASGRQASKNNSFLWTGMCRHRCCPKLGCTFGEKWLEKRSWKPRTATHQAHRHRAKELIGIHHQALQTETGGQNGYFTWQTAGNNCISVLPKYVGASAVGYTNCHRQLAYWLDQDMDDTKIRPSASAAARNISLTQSHSLDFVHSRKF